MLEFKILKLLEDLGDPCGLYDDFCVLMIQVFDYRVSEHPR